MPWLLDGSRNTTSVSLLRSKGLSIFTFQAVDLNQVLLLIYLSGAFFWEEEWKAIRREGPVKKRRRRRREGLLTVHFNLDSIVVWYTSIQWEESTLDSVFFILFPLPYEAFRIEIRSTDSIPHFLQFCQILNCFKVVFFVCVCVLMSILFRIYSCLPLEFCFNNQKTEGLPTVKWVLSIVPHVRVMAVDKRDKTSYSNR